MAETTLVANTGQNDPSSPWGSLLSTVGDVAGAVTNTVRTIQGRPTTVATPVAPPTQPTTDGNNTKLILIIGGAVALVLVLVLFLKK